MMALQSTESRMNTLNKHRLGSGIAVVQHAFVPHLPLLGAMKNWQFLQSSMVTVAVTSKM
jgi:hypothetical protein